MLIFLGLMFAHLLADYPLQGDFLANMKGESYILLVSHVGIWTGCITVAGLIMGLNIGVLDIAILFIIHTIADYLKATGRLWYKYLDSLKGGLLSDQLIHVGQIILLMVMTL
mgnify:CR=1 FL=1